MVEDDQELDNAVPYRIVCEDEIHRIPSWGCVFYPEIPAEYRILSGNQTSRLCWSIPHILGGFSMIFPCMHISFEHGRRRRVLPYLGLFGWMNIHRNQLIIRVWYPEMG